MIRYVLVLPAIMVGGLLGLLFLAAMPGLIGIVLWYGSDYVRHVEVIRQLIRPGMVLGGIIGGLIAACLLKRGFVVAD